VNAPGLDRSDASEAFAAAYSAAPERERGAPAVLRFLAERPVLEAYVQRGHLINETPRPVRWVVDHLSPTGIERYVQCPRRWFYQYALRLSDDDDDVTRMGLFVHRVLERYHSSAVDFSRAATESMSPEDVSSALAPIVEEEALKTAAAGGLSTDSSLFRYELARIKRQMVAYSTWLIGEARREPFTVVAVEQPIVVPLGEVSLVGRVDRVDALADGSLVIRDYKTGRFRTKPCGKALCDAFDRLDPASPGLGLFGAMPEDFKIQSLLYVRGVEAHFQRKVRHADYLYLGGSRENPDGIEFDSIDIIEDGVKAVARNGSLQLTIADLNRVYDVIGAGVAAEILGGAIRAFPTAIDDRTCHFCKFTAVCPGPGTIGYEPQ
jgi:hypothetical protein